MLGNARLDHPILTLTRPLDVSAEPIETVPRSISKRVAPRMLLCLVRRGASR